MDYPQNMPQWHIDYFEFKLLKSRCKRDTLAILPVSLEAGNESVMWQLPSLHLEVEGYLLTETGNLGKRAL